VANSGSNNVSILLNDGNWPASPATNAKSFAVRSNGLIPAVPGNPAPLAPPPTLDPPRALRSASLVPALDSSAPTPAYEYAKDHMVAANDVAQPPVAWTSWEIDKLAAELATGL
jgi:hypothetical protein